MRVLIPDGNRSFALTATWCLSQSDSIQTYAISNTRSPLIKYSRYCSGLSFYDANKQDSWLETICKKSDEWNIDVVLPIHIEAHELVVMNKKLIQKHAALPPLPSPECFMELNNKWQFYQFCCKYKLPTPFSVLYQNDLMSNENMVRDKIKHFKFPALLKPTKSSGGRGILFIENRTALHNLIKEKKISIDCEYLLQEYIEGTDLSVGVFCECGKIVTHVIQRSLLGVGNGFGPQAAMEFIKHDDALNLAARLVAAGKYSGVAFIDIRQNRYDQTLALIEVNPRFGQAIVGALRAGVNFPLLMCNSAMGNQEVPVNSQYARFIYPQPFANHMVRRLVHKEKNYRFSFSESGLKFIFLDPLPRLIQMFRALQI